MSAGVDDPARRQKAFVSNIPDMRTQLLKTHRRSFDGTTISLADAPVIFLHEGADFFRRFFFAKTYCQIIECHMTMPCINPISQCAASAPDARDDCKRQRLQQREKTARENVEQVVHFGSAETDFADAILKVVCAAD